MDTDPSPSADAKQDDEDDMAKYNLDNYDDDGHSETPGASHRLIELARTIVLQP
jgi:hypothetical protein